MEAKPCNEFEDVVDESFTTEQSNFNLIQFSQSGSLQPEFL